MFQNKIEFNTRWLLKQQDIFMQHLKVPQTKEELNVSIISHPITEKAQELVLKDIRKMSEEAKVAIRQVRRDGIDEFKKMQKESVITEDDLKSAEDNIQKLTDKYVDEIDQITTAKEKEIMTV